MTQIKVLHLGYSDNYGGASIAMKRIHDAVSLNKNIVSKIGVINKVTSNADVYSLSHTLLDKIWAYLRVRIAYKAVKLLQKSKNTSGRSVNIFSSSVLKRISSFDADVIHLHWIGNETIKLEDLPKIKQPIIWTFHDKWAMLGAEYTDISNSNRFVEGYSSSNFPKDSSGLDIDKWTWKRKQKVFAQKSIQPVAVSSWLSQEIKRSLIWKSSSPVVINNPIDEKIWVVKDKSQCRSELDLPSNTFIISFGAVNALSDELKGYQLLLKALMVIATTLPNENILCVIFGDDSVQTIDVAGNLKIRVIGKINNMQALNSIYSASDVVAVPSYFETFGQVALESVCCGTPVACFNTSGLRDVVRNGENGIFANPYDHDSLAHAIMEARNIKLTEKYIQGYAHRFSYASISQQYTDIYKQVLKVAF
ncbi:glycosyltransferase [Mucilaginibacter aquaedulcis]|uniref:glycosyltransferase n=1 Tax=Mucilaginibacter aquaedulcis TaxID=1187081 RepID=UPI0025B4C91A|nr:glycosyltransferase [Mucilaginibacter aquaedulcis]MDN3547639.1 glycosyltransferase [Mucilaginibacter aquaedulcis]